MPRAKLATEPDSAADRRADGNRRADIEAHLIKYGVSFTYRPDVSTGVIDFDRSLKNQARLGKALDEATVKRYTEAMSEGDEFPPLLAERVGGLWRVLDGNHRAAAAKAAGVSVDIYECEAKPQTLTLLMYLANTKHGLPSTEADRLHHALFLVDSGVTLKRAAAQLQVPEADLKKAAGKQNADRKADDAGIPRNQWDQLSAWARTRLAAVRTDEGMAAAVALAVDAGLGMGEIEPMVRGLNETGSSTRQVAAVKTMRLAYAERIGDTAAEGVKGTKGRPGDSPRTRLAMACGQATNLASPGAMGIETWPDNTREAMAERLDAAIARLTEIRKALG